MSEVASVTNMQIDKFSQQYKARRKEQMIRFFGVTALTLISARLAFRGPPPFSYKGEVVNALAYGTALSTGGFAMLGFGLCWIWDVSTLHELGAKLKQLMGDESKPVSSATNMELDEDTKKVAEALEAMFSSNNDGK
ncbi:Altered inheritance of mitochondria protein 11 [Kluyveromyces marxianus]|nr:Altered inheritance of mitochondria protein 11 [Kluyveromyces marxianus]KAG0681153.1 Altered inheritance of mitochondria protein 11 [Kluyveromyces marxianus]